MNANPVDLGTVENGFAFLRHYCLREGKVMCILLQYITQYIENTGLES